MAQAAHILSVRDLRVSMGSQEILHGIDLDLGANEIVAVLGANGVGKTTLMRALSGIYQSAGGQIEFNGTDITRRQAHEIVELGLCQAPEGRQIFSNMSVRDNLVLGGGRKGLAAFDSILPLFPVLGERMQQLAGSLSGGEQQMLCIARALMRGPKALLLDEPSLGLAPKLVKAIFDLVVKIRASGVPVLIVEQNARAALRIADRAAVMEGGRIVLSGAADDLRSNARIVDAYLGGHV